MAKTLHVPELIKTEQRKNKKNKNKTELQEEYFLLTQMKNHPLQKFLVI